MNETLNEHVIMLAQQREYTKEVENKFKEAEKIANETPEYKAFVEMWREHDKARKTEIMLYDLVRSIALDMSSNTNYDDRNPHPATKVKEFTVVIIDNEKQAKQWATKNAPSTLSLNKTKFNKVAKELEVDFVHNEIEYRASVSRDLSEYAD